MSHASSSDDLSSQTRAELVAHLASGETLDLRNRDDTGRTIAGSLLREVLSDTCLARDHRGLTILGALIPDDLDLSYCTMPVPLRLPGACFKGVLSLVGATITGKLELTGAKFEGRNDHGNALTAERMQVNGDAILSEIDVAHGAIRLMGAIITGALSLRDATLDGKDNERDALVADRMRVDGDAILDNLTVTWGGIRLMGAIITGALSLRDAALDASNDDGSALVADRLRVHGDAFMKKLTVTLGSVRFPGAVIDGQLELTEAKLNGRNEDENALFANRLRVEGGVFMKNLEVTGGAVCLTGATITGRFELTEAKLEGKDSNGDALVADSLWVKGDALMSQMKVAEGAIRLLGATITGQLKLGKAELNGKNDHGNALAADRLRVGGSVILRSMKVINGATLALRYGRLGNLVLDDESPTGGWPQHNFEGLQYEQLHGGPARSAREGTHLLASQTDRPRAAQPYWQLADYYARVGNEAAARHVRVRSNAMQARAHPESWPRALLYGLTTGFGYYPFVALLWLALLIGLDAAAVNAHSNDFIPTKAPITTASSTRTQGAVTSSVCEPRYPCFNPVLYATDTVVPVISLGQQDAWRIDTSQAGTGLQVTLLATKVAGWVLTTLLVGGIGGLLRRS